MATQADLYMDLGPGSDGKPCAMCRRCSAEVADTVIHTAFHVAAFGSATVAWPTTSQHGHISA